VRTAVVDRGSAWNGTRDEGNRAFAAVLAGFCVGRAAGRVNAHTGAGHEHRLVAIVPAHDVGRLTARALVLFGHQVTAADRPNPRATESGTGMKTMRASPWTASWRAVRPEAETLTIGSRNVADEGYAIAACGGGLRDRLHGCPI
jgi:hypothetical protein